MGMPTAEVWPGFTSLPNYQSNLFPQWTENQLCGLLKKADESQYSLLTSLLRFDPSKRSSAEEALRHK